MVEFDLHFQLQIPVFHTLRLAIAFAAWPVSHFQHLMFLMLQIRTIVILPTLYPYVGHICPRSIGLRNVSLPMTASGLHESMVVLRFHRVRCDAIVERSFLNNSIFCYCSGFVLVHQPSKELTVLT